MDSQIEEREDITVFWDFESTIASSIASGVRTYDIVKNIRSVLAEFGIVTSLRIYWDYAGYAIPAAAARIRSELSSSGACLIDCPSEGRKEAARKKMLVDLLLHAWDQPSSHTYAIISGDRDAACVIATLEMRGYSIILLSPAGTHPDLTSQASIQLDWTIRILGVSGQAGVFDNIYKDFRPTSAPPLSSQIRQESFGFQKETTATPPPRQSPRGNPTIPSGPNRSESSLKLGLEFSRTLSTLPQGANSLNAAKSRSTLVNVFTPPGSVQHRNIHGSIPMSPSQGKGRLMTPNFKDSAPKFEPFNEDQVDEPHLTRKASVVTMSSLSSPVDSLTFSIVEKPEPSTAPTSAEEERKLEKPSLPLTPLPDVQEKDIKLEGSSKLADKLFTPAPAANSVPVLPSTKPMVVGIQTTTAMELKPTPAPSSSLTPLPIPKTPPTNLFTLSQPNLGPVYASTIPTACTPQPSAILRSIPTPALNQPKSPVLRKPPVATPSVQVGSSNPVAKKTIPPAWKPLFDTLRKHNGILAKNKIAATILHSYPDAFILTGHQKFKSYLQSARNAGYVQFSVVGQTPAVRLAEAYAS